MSALGYQALFNNIDGAANTAIGVQALVSNTVGSSNVAAGNYALLSNSTGDTNTAVGFGALEHNTGGNDNIAVGFHALDANMTGDSNTAVGTGALQSSAGNGNTAVGAGAGAGVSIGNNVICIGAQGANVDNSCYVGNIFGATSSGGVAVLVNADGKLGTTPSSRQFKEEITRMDQASEAIFALEPVTFRYKKEIDSTAASQFGLLAQDVEKVNRDLVVRDKEGQAYSVRYDQVNAMLLNEFLKEHKAFLEEQRKVQEQESVIAQQRRILS